MTRTQIQKHWKSGRQNKKASFEYGADVKKTNTTNTTDKKTKKQPGTKHKTGNTQTENVNYEKKFTLSYVNVQLRTDD